MTPSPLTPREPGGGTTAPGSERVTPVEVPPSQQVLAQLQQKLETLPTIEQAKGILMARFSLDADAAFSLLVRWSQINNVKLRAVSASLADAATRPGALDALVDSLQRRAGGFVGTRADGTHATGEEAP